MTVCHAQSKQQIASKDGAYFKRVKSIVKTGVIVSKPSNLSIGLSSNLSVVLSSNLLTSLSVVYKLIYDKM